MHKDVRELAFYSGDLDIYAALLAPTSVALDSADKLAREFHGLCSSPDCTRLIERHKWPVRLTEIVYDQNRWADMTSVLSKVPALVSKLSSKKLMRLIVHAQTAAGSAVAIHTPPVSQATDILAR